MSRTKKRKGQKKATAVVAAIVILVAVSAVAFGMLNNSKPEKKAIPKKRIVKECLNPLTGENLYNKKADGRRCAAIVVENHPDARPQLGIEDPKNPPDIILQGEVEGGITRTLWFYADYTAVPDKIGPIRSARPPFIRFSELFDAIFVHWGMSGTSGGYIGASTVFKTDKVDHINQMSYHNKTRLFSRDSSRAVNVEHTGILSGSKLPKSIRGLKFRTMAKQDRYTKLPFRKKAEEFGDNVCNKVSLKFSNRSQDVVTWEYSRDDMKYHTNAFINDVSRDNILMLFDKTEYIVKPNYHGSGLGVSYCDYKLAGGKGRLASRGGNHQDSLEGR